MWLSKGMVIESFSIDVYPQNDVVIFFSSQMTIRVDKKTHGMRDRKTPHFTGATWTRKQV